MKVLDSGARRKGEEEQHPIDCHYRELKCQLSPVERENGLFSLVEKYVRQTHAKTHSQYRMEVLDVFEMDRSGEKEAFRDVGNRCVDGSLRTRGQISDDHYPMVSKCGIGRHDCMCEWYVVVMSKYHFASQFDTNSFYRQLLWHGSRLTNWVGILSQGLRIAPPEAPVTGYMVCAQIVTLRLQK